MRVRGAWLVPAGVSAGLGALLGAAALRDPFLPGHWPGCPFHAVTGLYCPLCGATRAAWASGHGRWALMLQSNPLFLAAVVATGWACASWLTATTGTSSTFRLPVPHGRVMRWGAASVGAAFWVLRNTATFSFLAPHGHP